MQGYDGASAAAGQVAGNQGQAEEPGWYANFMAKNTEELLNYMQYTNLCNAICILTVGVLGIFTFASTFNFNILFIGLYTTIFGCLLCCLESRFEAMTKILRKYFGFLFSFMGRTLFLLFVALFCFGVFSGGSGYIFSIVTGVLTFLNAMMNLVAVLCHPAFKDTASIWDDPTLTYAAGEGVVAGAATNFAVNNPELAAKAIGAGAAYAAERPQVAMQAASAYAGANQGRAGDDGNPFA